MHMKKMLVATAFGAASILCSVPGSSQAEPYPLRPITLVVATAAGGPGDAAARIIAERMTDILGQQIVIENVPGAGGITGAARVARAAPDGYTLLIHQTGITIQPALNKSMPFSLEKDLTAVGLVNITYGFLIARKSLPAADMRELVSWMKSSGEQVRLAHPGVGSLGHLASVLFAKSVGVSVNLVPYRGIGPAMNDLVGEHVDLLYAGAVSAAPLIKAGTVKAYAFIHDKRSRHAPSVPSTGELGYKDITVPFWHALFAPAQTPRPIIERLNAGLRQALQNPKVAKIYADNDMEAFPPEQLTIEAANDYIRSEVFKWSKVVRDNNIQAVQ